MVKLAGQIIAPVQSTRQGGWVYTTLRHMRPSGYEDKIPLLMTERTAREIKEGDYVRLSGRVRARTRNGRLKSAVFVEKAEKLEKPTYENGIHLRGFLSQPPVYRTTPLHKRISEMMLAVPDEWGGWEHIPVIAWDGNAAAAEKMAAGAKVEVSGRLQSRTYCKVHEDGTEETRTVYEVSAYRLLEEVR